MAIETATEPTSTTNTANTADTPSKTTPIADPLPSDAEESKSNGAGAAYSADVAKEDPVSDIKKQMKRAERFGVSVQLSETEKRNIRAERFGTAPIKQGSDAPKNAEDQKRKAARAERFGFGQGQPVSAKEEAKKKARLARFGEAPKTNQVEEDKKKARALRFSQPVSAAYSQVNEKGNEVEPKMAIAGKAGGGT